MIAQSDFNPQAPVVTDLYYAVHKGIRLANIRLLTVIGQSDPADASEIAAMLNRLEQHLDLSHAHLKHENTKVHTVVEARVPGGAGAADEDHDHHLATFAELRDLASELALASDGSRADVLRRLYQRFALFVAEDFQHMHEEETRLMPLIAAHFSPEEIAGIEHSIVTSIEPRMLVSFMKVMLGAANRSERIAAVAGMKAAMPPEVFAQVFAGIVHPDWRHDDWDEMERVLC